MGRGLSRARKPRLKFLGSLSLLAGFLATIVCQVEVGARGKVDTHPTSARPRAPSTIVEQTTSDPELPPSIRTRGRVIAIGDLHGDLAASRRVLRMAKIVDEAGAWIGGDSVVVQTGDLLDRGDDERPLLDWLDRLAEQAKAAGGGLYWIQGNHEVMNVAGDFRYVSEAGLRAFAEYAHGPSASADPAIPVPQRGRWSAFRPGGPWANRLAPHPVVLQINDSVFVHGGLLPRHVRYGIGRLNTELSAWMRGKGPLGPILSGDDAPYWVRTYGNAVTPEDCRALDDILTRLSAKRLVIGHTPQKGGISFACADRVARIDVGLSAAYGDQPAQALEIVAGTMKVLTEAKPAR